MLGGKGEDPNVTFEGFYSLSGPAAGGNSRIQGVILSFPASRRRERNVFRRVYITYVPASRRRELDGRGEVRGYRPSTVGGNHSPY